MVRFRQCQIIVLLLALLLPLLAGLRWLGSTGYSNVAVAGGFIESRHRILFQQQFCGTYGRLDLRFFVLDLDEESLQELRSPNPFGLWYQLHSVDAQGKLLAFTRYQHLVLFDPATQTSEPVGFRDSDALLDGRYLIRRDSDGNSPLFCWRDLTDVNRPFQTAPIDEHVVNPLVTVTGSRCFYSLVDDDDATDWQFSPDVLAQTHPAFVDDLRMLILFELKENGPIELARWPVLGSGEVQSAAGRIACLSLDRSSIEIRAVQDGSSVTSIAIPPEVVGATPRAGWSLNQSILTFRDWNGNHFTFDIDSGRFFAESGIWIGEQFDIAEKEYVSIRRNGFPKSQDPYVQIRDRSTGRVLSDFAFPTQHCFLLSPLRGVIATREPKIVFATSDMRLLFMDKQTGQVVRSINARYWHPYWKLSIGVCLLAWVGCWMKASMRFGLNWAFDSTLLVSILSYFLWSCITLAGSPYDATRPAWQAVGGLSISLGLLSAYHCTRPGTSLGVRLLPGLLLIICCINGAYYFWLNRWFAHQSIVSLMVLTILLPAAAWFTRRWSPFAVETNKKQRRMLQMSLASLSVITSVVALAAGFAMRVDFNDWTHTLRPGELVEIGATTSLYAIIVTTSWAAMMSRGWWTLRAAGLVIVFMLSTCGLMFCDQWGHNGPVRWNPQLFVEWSITGLLMVATTLLIALPLQLRQVRRS